MRIISIFLFFILPANILATILLGFNIKRQEKIKQNVILFLSYGIAPLLNGLFFYYLVWFFPNKSNLFYIAVAFLLWAVILILVCKNILKLANIYSDLFINIKKEMNKKTLLFISPIILFIIIFSFQIFAFPIIEGDNAYYINQSRALYESKNLNYEDKVTVIGGNDDYIYNSSIRPGIPAFLALSFSLNNNSNDYFAYTFLLAFYHILLLLFFLFLVKKLTIKLGKQVMPALFFGGLFFVFSWTLTKVFILGAKESIIYFLTLLSLYLIYKLIKLERRDIFLEIILGIVIGLNTFINTHGIIVGLILFLLLIIFSKISIFGRLKQLVIIFVFHLIFGSFEFLINFWGIFFPSIKIIADHFSIDLSNIKFLGIYNYNPINNISNNTAVKIHKNLYQVSNIKEVYLKGKLQILTNIGMFGFYFWFFLLMIFNKLKEILSSKLGRFFIFFIFLYIFIVIDPFNINTHPMAIVLWGSPKYARLVLLVSMIITSVYFWPFLNKLFLLISKNNKIILPTMTIVLICSIIFKNILLNLGFKLLFLTVPFYKDSSFYRNKISLLLFFFIIALLFCLFTIVLIRNNKIAIAKKVFIFIFIFIFILLPFFATVVGKVPLEKTFSYIGKNQEDKLINISNLGSSHDVYFFAKKDLPEGSLIKTEINELNELYIYDDYFHLTMRQPNAPYYEISDNCNTGILYSKDGFNLCAYN